VITVEGEEWGKIKEVICYGTGKNLSRMEGVAA
jgi:hypothetical protein